jgi:hypothetical protein
MLSTIFIHAAPAKTNELSLHEEDKDPHNTYIVLQGIHPLLPLHVGYIPNETNLNEPDNMVFQRGYRLTRSTPA